MEIRYGYGGWVRFREAGKSAVIYLQLDATTGGVRAVHVEGGGAEVSHDTLRRIPLGRLRAQAGARPDLLLAASNSGPAPEVLADLEAAFAYLGADASITRLPPRVALKGGPPDGKLTDSFLRDVAAAYRSALAYDERPNKALADQSGQDRRNVERWVYLARKAGHLPPTTKGAAR